MNMRKSLTFMRRYAAHVLWLLLAAVALPPVAMHAQKKATSVEALAARLQTLEDLEEIRNLLVAYGRSLDSRDFRAYSQLFTKDGEWSGGMGTVTGGPQAIYDFMTSRIGGARQGGGGSGQGGGSSYHIMSNFKIDVNGDTATASSRWTFVTAARGPGINLAGTYEDTLVRENGEWKFKKRQAFNDVTAPGAGPQPTAGSASTPPARQ
jgi:hypothetical protein